MTETLRVVAAIGGLVLIIGMLSDAVATLIVTQGNSGLWRPTRLFYAATWRVVKALAARMGDRSGEYLLNVYPALSLLGLLVLWLAGLMVGWSLVYWGLDQHVGGTRDWGTLVYYAGTSLVTPVFGSAHGALVRMLTLLETLTGVVTIALMISYLPALYGAYSRREARLLTLDDPLGGRITPVRVVALNAPGGDVEMLYRALGEWQMWTADVLESHVSYPMLALFRSQHPGQSWVTALGVVTDAATLTSACVEGAQSREPYFLYGADAAPSSRYRAACTSRRRESPPRGWSRRTSSSPGASWPTRGFPCGTRPRRGRICRCCAPPTGTSSSA